MQFNRYIWDLYRNSPEGQAAIKRDIADHIVQHEHEPPPFIHFLNRMDVSIDEYGHRTIFGGDYQEVNLRDFIAEYARAYKSNNIEEAEDLFISLLDYGINWNIYSEDRVWIEIRDNTEDDSEDIPEDEQPLPLEDGQIILTYLGGNTDPDSYRTSFTSITALSTGFYDAYPDLFAPYLFTRKFDHLTKICHFFGVTLPDAPTKQQKPERAVYYLEINRVLQAFRHEHGLSPEELNAFLYDFAPRNVKLTNTNTLPEASRVWFSIGNSVDFEYLDEANEESISFWQGNLEARRGDIVLMWCASPRSYLHSIWRVVDDGFNDPFFYYYNSIRVGHPLKIPPITFKTFAQDPFLGTSPAVKAHFQGRSGSALSLEEYQAICGLIRQTGFDTTLLPTAPSELTLGDLTLNNERDVETQLLEPLLLKLGFTETDWVRQLPVRMGRGQRNYPDYVLGCDLKPGEESAISVLECKFRIGSPKELKDAFLQAKSYALRLQAQSLTLADARGIWIFQQRSDGFVFDAFTFKVWKELTHPDILHEISLIFGKKVIDDAVQSRLRNMKAHSKPKG